MANAGSSIDEFAQLVYGYCTAFDTGDIEAAVACFTDDAILSTPSAEAQRSDGRPHDHSFRAGGKPVIGREAIRQYLVSARQKRASLGWQPRHLITNLYIVASTDREVTLQSYVTFLVTGPDGSTFVDHAGVMIDTVAREPSGWKFKEHRIRIDADQNFMGRPPEAPTKT